MADGVATRFLLNPLGVGWMTKYLESLVPLGVGFSLFDILNIEYRTRNFEQQKLLKGIRQCFSLRHSAVPCSAVHVLKELIADR